MDVPFVPFFRPVCSAALALMGRQGDRETGRRNPSSPALPFALSPALPRYAALPSLRFLRDLDDNVRHTPLIAVRASHRRRPNPLHAWAFMHVRLGNIEPVD